MNNSSVFLKDEQATEGFGNTLSKITQGKGIITLSGNLGVGKTTLSRGLIRAFGHKGAVKSPTYTIIEPYEFENQRVMHLDLYRLEDPEELEFLGFRDLIDDKTLCLIEWPEKAHSALPAIDLELTLTYHENQGRMISWQANTDYGHELSRKLNTLYSI